MLTEVQGAQLVHIWPPGEVSDEHRTKCVQEVQERVSKKSKELGLKMIGYIYGASEGPVVPSARRGRKPKWSEWEI